MKGYRFLGVGGNLSARRKPTKAGMESANQIHIQPLTSCIGERKVFEHKPTRLATGVVCHPDAEQNRPYKIPWPCQGLNWGPTAPYLAYDNVNPAMVNSMMLHSSMYDLKRSISPIPRVVTFGELLSVRNQKLAFGPPELFLVLTCK